MKKKRDGGFTLIELMIVIAVIGILAIVLIPKVGTIKTQAKSSGIDTNVRTVEGYIQSRISSWADSGTDRNTIAADIYSAFTSGATDKVKNPFSGSIAVTNGSAGTQDAININSTDPGTNTSYAGLVGVTVTAPVSSSVPIVVYAHDSGGAVISDKTVTIYP